MAEATKDTIYIDLDDEITTIIEKVLASKHKIVALVLPKRAATLQSIVNMKLLKRTGKESGKRIVLITSEASLLPLAGIVGLYVAKTLQSKPTIPPPPESLSPAEAVVDEEPAEDSEPAVDASKSIGELAGLPDEPKHVTLGAMAVEETIDVDNTDGALEKTAGAAKKAKKNKIKIPNFESFRLRLILGAALLVALIVGWVFGFMILPKARVVVKTDTKTIATDLSFSANSGVKELDVEKNIVPAEVKEVKKTDSLKVTATGQKNVGEKASGTMTLSLTDCSKPSVTVPTGTTVSSNGLNFITQTDVTLSSVIVAGTCKNSSYPSLSTGTTNVISQNAGEQYNLSSRSYAVAGFSNVIGTGSAMTGGTTKNVTVISQQDVDAAKQQLKDKSRDPAIADLTKTLQDAKLLALAATLNAADPAITTTPNVGDEAADVTVTGVTTYTMLGVKEDDLKKLIEASAQKQVDLTKQPLVDYGLDKAIFKLGDKRSPTDQTLTGQSIATAGTKIDPEALKKEIIGKERGDVEKAVQAHPGVTDVTVNFSPPWISKIPAKTSKITIVFEQTAANASN